DTLNGNPATLATVNLTQVSTTNPNVTLNTTTGSVNVTPGTPGGPYVVTYQICETLNPTNCDTATVTVFVEDSKISITKDGTYVDANNDGITNVGDIITYAFVVTNTGNTTLTNISVTDINATVTGGPLATLAVGASDATTFTATHTITQDDINAGVVYNLATATGHDPHGNPIVGTSTDPTPCATCPVDPTCTNCTITPLNQTPSIKVTKDGTYVDANNDGITNVGDIITYAFVVTNTGNTTLTNISVTDINATVTGGPLATLAVGASDATTFTATHTITQDDINAGMVYNLATATGHDPHGNPIVGTSTDPTPCATCPVDPTCTDCTITPLNQTPSIKVTKDGTYVDANNDGITNVGDIITYAFVVTNTGNTTLTNISVTDINATVTGGPLATLAVGASDATTFTATHTITQDDINAGMVYNLATVTGHDPHGNPIVGTSTDPTPCATCPVDPTCTNCTITPLNQTPSIKVTKDGTYVDANNDGITNVGDIITYAFVVTNTGNTTLTNISVTDINATVTGGPLATLAVGASDATTFTATHTITQDDINAGVVYNLATATGHDPHGNPIVGTSTDPTPCATCPVDPTCTDCTITPLNQTPSIKVTKDGTYVDANNDGITNVGDIITYAFVVTNTGNTTLTNISVTDINATVTGGPLATLAVGASDATTFTATHTITQDDINAGVVYNLATATGHDPHGNPIVGTSTDPTPCATCPVDPTCTNCTITPLNQTPSIKVTKDGTYVDANNDGITNVGDIITYAFVVTNTGNTTLTNISVTDINATVTGGPLATLAVGASDATTFTATHTITQDDINAGVVYNLATATGHDPHGNPIVGTSTDPTPCTTCLVDPTCTNCTITTLNQTPSIKVTKDGTYVDANNDGITNVGDIITYAFVVTNTGNTTLTNISVTDINATVTGGPLATLAVGASDATTFTATHTITQDDINAGVVYNLATATGHDPHGNPIVGTSTDPTPCATCPVDPTCTDCTITPLNQTPSIKVTKDGTYVDANNDGITNVGDIITYAFVVTNTGNTTLTNIAVTDINATVTGGPLATLAVGASDTTTFTATHTITQDDINAGMVYNLATATGHDPHGNPIVGTSTDPTPCTTCPVDPTCTNCTITPLNQTPSIKVTKDGTYVDANNDGITNVGDIITYAFVVTNTGNTTLTNISVTDINATVTGGPLATLAVGASDATTFTATHTITQDDINAGVVYNLATATGHDPHGNPIVGTSTDPTPCTTCPVDPTCTDCTITPLNQTPSIKVTKDGTYVDANNDGITNVGDIITYAFVVTNTGNTTLTNISVTDINATVTGGPLATLAVGASDTTTFTATHTITQDDINAGMVYNLATATGHDPHGNPIVGTSTDPTPCTTCPVDPTCTDCTITPLNQTPSIKVTKDGTYVDANNDGITNVGDIITYAFVVTNTGNTTLTNISVTDINATVTGGPLATLAVGASDATTFTATHTITQDDINAGMVYNLATATGHDPHGNPIVGTSTDPTPCTTCPVDPTCTNCTITPLINANNDTFINIACDVDAVTGNILSNDTLGNIIVNTTTESAVTLTILTGSYPNISIDNSGNIHLTSGINVGAYTFTYQICSTVFPNVCDQATVTINVTDTTNPTWTSSLPQDITVSCDAVPTAPNLTGNDVCGNTTITYNEVRVDGSCPNNYNLIRTWVLTDASLNSITYTQTITVQDTTAPTFVETLPANVTVECNAVPTAPTLTATDNCG
ncbi:hypothetical protein OX284_017065, partial [Flavobacterium sp. SUN046]|uniref:DUF7507 domain-containing protein n=1 Tax=Flavobacterium sp. SUN046 TaxID=3002440 RepID=UPI002DC67D12|nr:hypothetical protein [Flavobacterium sp. SUN046]